MDHNFRHQDELEKLRHSAQMDKNNLTTSLASIEEQNRHLTSKLQVGALRMQAGTIFGVRQNYQFARIASFFISM